MCGSLCVMVTVSTQNATVPKHCLWALMMGLCPSEREILGQTGLRKASSPGPGSVLFWRVSSLTFQKLPSKDAQFDCAVTSDSGARRRPDLTH